MISTTLDNNDLSVACDESTDSSGNWLIRADTGEPAPTPTPTRRRARPRRRPQSGDALWYNGDFNDVNGLANERDTSLGSGQYASVYDDFNVPDGDGWDVTSVFSNNLADTSVTGATYEIRQGVSAGNAGTLIASGMTVTPTVDSDRPERVWFHRIHGHGSRGLSVHLDPGTYHLNVTPTGNLTGRSFDSTTSGANCVGTPCGNNQNAFFDSNFFGAFFANTADFGQPYDFSMGVNGTSGGGGGITLTGMIRRSGTVGLKYTGTDHSGTVDILRDGVAYHTSADSGRAQDRGAVSGTTYTYQVCETGTSNCSNTVTVVVP